MFGLLLGFGLASSAGFCSGDAEFEAALLSRSSRRFFSFLPIQGQLAGFAESERNRLTIVALSYPVLNSSPLCEI